MGLYGLVAVTPKKKKINKKKCLFLFFKGSSNSKLNSKIILGITFFKQLNIA
jgi:hypothetical protein